MPSFKIPLSRLYTFFASWLVTFFNYIKPPIYTLLPRKPQTKTTHKKPFKTNLAIDESFPGLNSAWSVPWLHLLRRMMQKSPHRLQSSFNPYSTLELKQPFPTALLLLLNKCLLCKTGCYKGSGRHNRARLVRRNVASVSKATFPLYHLWLVSGIQ